jgi:hypothetical protein
MAIAERSQRILDLHGNPSIEGGKITRRPSRCEPPAKLAGP